MLSDLQIAQQAEILKVTEIAKKVGLSLDDLELYGNYKAKIHLDKLNWVLSKTKFIALCDCLKEEGIINGYKYYFYDEVIF